MLVLVRHGQTDANARGILQGHVDLPLSELGRRQARALAPLIPADARVVVSPLRRSARAGTSERAGEVTREITETMLRLHGALLRSALDGSGS